MLELKLCIKNSSACSFVFILPHFYSIFFYYFKHNFILTISNSGISQSNLRRFYYFFFILISTCRSCVTGKIVVRKESNCQVCRDRFMFECQRLRRLKIVWYSASTRLSDLLYYKLCLPILSTHTDTYNRCVHRILSDPLVL